VKNLVNDYLESLDQFLQSSIRLGEAIRNALLPVIPDLKVYVSFASLDFVSNTFKNERFDYTDTESLVSILESVFCMNYINIPEKACVTHFDSFFGVYLDKETAQQVRQILEKALNENGPVQLRLNFRDEEEEVQNEFSSP
jgi:hypothetical protein